MNKMIKKVLGYGLLIAFGVLMLFPFGWMFLSSFKPLEDIFSSQATIIPDTIRILNYIEIFTEKHFDKALFNSLYISSIYTAGSVFFCALCGYGFSKYEFKFKRILLAIVISSLMVPMETNMVPQYILFNKIGWIDSHLALIVPGLANAFGIFFMNQYYKNVDDAIIESGRIDGSSEFGIFLRIIMPIIKPAIASLGIIFFMNSWNNFVTPLIVIKSENLRTLPVAIQALDQGVNQTPYHLIMSSSVVSILPLLIIFIAFQKYFIDGITQGAVKG